MPRQTIIIGAGIGGLSAAIYARLQGWEVLVVEAGSTPGGKAAGIRQDGFFLDPGPSIIILPRLYQAVFESAGRDMKDFLAFDRLETISRVYFEGQDPVDLPADYGDCQSLLKKIAPQDAAGFDRLMQTLDSVAPLVDESVFKKPFLKPSDIASLPLLKFGVRFNPLRDYKTLVDGYFASPLLRAFFYGFPSYSGQTYNSKAPGAFLIPYYMLREGVFFPKGGVRAIPQAFYRLARELGVEFRFNSRVKKFVTGEKVRAVELEDGERLQADQFVSNVDPWTLPPDNQPPAGEPSFSYFTIHWGLANPAASPGLDHHTLFVPADFERGFQELYTERRFPTRPIVYLNAVQDRDPEAAPEGKELLFAVITSPADLPHIDWQLETPHYKDRVRQELARHGLTFPDEDIQLERVQNPLYFAQNHGNFKGSLYGPEENHRLWGLFPLPNRDPRYSNVAFCGGAVQPGAGLPMATLSGKFAIDILASKR